MPLPVSPTIAPAVRPLLEPATNTFAVPFQASPRASPKQGWRAQGLSAPIPDQLECCNPFPAPTEGSPFVEETRTRPSKRGARYLISPAKTAPEAQDWCRGQRPL